MPTGKVIIGKEKSIYLGGVMGNHAFIDGQNLIKGVEKMGWRLDLKKFRRYLSDKFNVTRAFYFIGYIRKYENLYGSLRSYGYELIFKETVGDGQGGIKGNVDAELVLEAMKQKEKGDYEKAVIVAGDGDYTCLAKELQSLDKLEAVLAPNQRYCSRLLKKNVQNLIFMDDLQRKLEFKMKRGGRP